jgi:hypothetical protein
MKTLIEKIKSVFRTRPPTDAELEARAEMKVINERASNESADNHGQINF